MKKSLALLGISAGIIWYAPGAVQATYCTSRTPQYCQTTTTSSTTTTVAPTTTLPLETTVPETTPTTVVIPESSVTTVPPRCTNEAPYPQSYAVDAPCGPTDPCIGIDPATGLGSTMWTFQTCGTPVATTTPSNVATTTIVDTPPTLPETGNETLWIAVAAGLTLAAGIGIAGASRRGDS